MGLLDRAIKRGINNAVSNAVEQGVRKAVEPKIEQAAANVVNSAADSINSSSGTQQQTAPAQGNVNQESVNQAANTLGGLFGGLAGAATSFANEAAKNMKLCASCGEAAGKDETFCPKCGAKLPEQTVSEGAVCSSCGAQNTVGTKFCTKCGEKLPAAIAEEQALQAKNEAVMAKWEQALPQYPKWSFGGVCELEEENDGEKTFYRFSVNFGQGGNGESPLNQYRQLLQQNGFRQAGQYPSASQLYKKIDDTCYCFDSENCFDGGTDYLTLYFMVKEPAGGFDYVKPEPKQKTSFFDLFK